MIEAPLEPMLARLSGSLPEGEGWLYEPKWDGFRALVFRDGPELLLQSRDLKPLNRYFPELQGPLRASLPPRCVLDGEIVIAGAGGLDFDALLLRIHPAASRVQLLAERTPASFVAFDLLALGDENLLSAPLSERRAALERALAQARPPIHLTPATRERALAPMVLSARSRASRPRATMATSAPDAANLVATASPMPLLPPVTTAALPARLISTFPSLVPRMNSHYRAVRVEQRTWGKQNE